MLARVGVPWLRCLLGVRVMAETSTRPGDTAPVVLYHSNTPTALTQTSFARYLMCQLRHKDFYISVFSLEENPQILTDPPQNVHLRPHMLNLWSFTHILTPVRSSLDDFLPLNFD